MGIRAVTYFTGMQVAGEQPDVQVKTFTITVETPDGALPPADVSVPDVPMGLADIVPPLYQLCSGTVALAVRRAESEGRKVSCGPGCGVCCNQLVPLSIPEALFLVDLVKQKPLDERAEILRRFSRIRAVLEKKGLLEPLRGINDRADAGELPAAYWNLGLSCPFLVQESCFIHEARPCACREYNVTSAPEFCADLLGGKVDRVRTHRKTTTALARVAATLLNIPAVLVPMPLLFDWFESHEEYAGMRWQGIGLFDLALECALK